jgi:5-methyltetrahydrofolate--homocysteine methyltransferase
LTLTLVDLLKEIEESFAKVAPIEKTRECVERALTARISPVEIMQSMRDGLATAGKKYEQGEFFLSELIMSGIMAQEISNILKPHLQNSRNEPLGKVVICTVKGDVHDLGKNLVIMMLSSSGFDVIDLGVDVAPEKLVNTVVGENPAIAAMSCLLTTAMDQMKITIDQLTTMGIRKRVKVLVGGRPITSEFSKEIGADGYGPDAIEAVNVARGTINK